MDFKFAIGDEVMTSVGGRVLRCRIKDRHRPLQPLRTFPNNPPLYTLSVPVPGKADAEIACVESELESVHARMVTRIEKLLA